MIDILYWGHRVGTCYAARGRQHMLRCFEKGVCTACMTSKDTPMVAIKNPCVEHVLSCRICLMEAKFRIFICSDTIHLLKKIGTLKLKLLLNAYFRDKWNLAMKMDQVSLKDI